MKYYTPHVGLPFKRKYCRKKFPCAFSFEKTRHPSCRNNCLPALPDKRFYFSINAIVYKTGGMVVFFKKHTDRRLESVRY